MDDDKKPNEEKESWTVVVAVLIAVVLGAILAWLGGKSLP